MTGNAQKPGTGNGEQGTGKDVSGSPFPVPRSPPLGVLFAWLAARPRGRWATARGRCVQTGLTASLLLAGLAAWALALVQPWTRPGRADLGIVTIAGGMDTGKIRAAAADVERLCATAPTPVKPLRRNPFAPKAASAAPDRRPSATALGGVREPRTPAGGAGPQPDAGASGYVRTCPAAPAAGLGAAPAVQAVLEAVRGLRLEVILTTPAGERWTVINGRNLREGDRIAGLEIVEIQEGRVRLQQGGVTCLLRMD